LLHNHPHLSSGAGTIGQKWPQYKGLSPNPLAIKKYEDLNANQNIGNPCVLSFCESKGESVTSRIKQAERGARN
jgi:hypothetical protein